MAMSTDACWGGHFSVEPGIFLSNRAFFCRTMHFAVEPGFFLSNEYYNNGYTFLLDRSIYNEASAQCYHVLGHCEEGNEMIYVLFFLNLKAPLKHPIVGRCQSGACLLAPGAAIVTQEQHVGSGDYYGF